MSKYQVYSAYKDSGTDWLGNIPTDWTTVRLKYVANLAGEKVAQSSKKYVGMENVSSRNGKYVATEDTKPEGISSSFQKGDVLFGKLRPYLAKSWVADYSGICSSEFLVLRSIKVSPKFLNYYTLTEEFVEQVNSSTYGSKMPRASWEFIGLLPVPVSNYEHTEKIADFLDHETAKIDKLIDKQQLLIKLLKDKRQAVISHAITKGLNPNAPMKDSGVEWLGEVPKHWDVVQAKYIADITRGAILRPVNAPEYFDEKGEWAYLNISDATKCDKYLYESKLRLSDLGSTKSARVRPENLIITASATIGKAFINKIKVCVHDGFIPFCNINIIFLLLV